MPTRRRVVRKRPVMPGERYNPRIHINERRRAPDTLIFVTGPQKDARVFAKGVGTTYFSLTGRRRLKNRDIRERATDGLVVHRNPKTGRISKNSPRLYKSWRKKEGGYPAKPRTSKR